MKDRYVHYSALISLGNYNNERYGFTVSVEEEDSVPDVVEMLKRRVEQCGGKDASKLYTELRRGQQELEQLEAKILRKRQEWEQVSEFLKAQGINPGVAPMPMFHKLLTSVEEEEYHETDDPEEGEFVDSEY